MLLDPGRESVGREDEDHDDVRADPREDDVRAAVAVVVRLLRRRVAVLLLLWGLVRERGARRLPDLVDVLARGRQLDFQHLLAVLALDLLGPAEVLRRAVVTLGTPGDIVQVTHGVHHCKHVSIETMPCGRENVLRMLTSEIACQCMRRERDRCTHNSGARTCIAGTR